MASCRPYAQLQSGVPTVVGCPQLRIQYIRNYLPYLGGAEIA
jgi:hypothetical protein